LKKRPSKFEILARRSSELDDNPAIPAVFVARLVIAQRRAEHLELALVPTAHEIEPNAFTDVRVTNSLAAMSGGISGACTVRTR